MQLANHKKARLPDSSADVHIRMLSILFMPISVMMLIWIMRLLRLLVVYWVCTAKYDDTVNIWMGSGSSPITTISMFLAIICLMAVFTYLEWWYERTHLGVRDWKRSCIYVMAIAVCASMVLLMVKIQDVLAII